LPDGVIDATDHFVNSEGVLGNLRSHDIAIVTVGHGSESVSFFYSSADEHIFIGAVAHDSATLKVRAKAIKRLTVEVYHSDIMPIFVHDVGQCRADATTAQNEQSHIPFSSGMSGAFFARHRR